MEKIIVGTLILLCSITGCSDMPYTGSVLPVQEVDRYLVSTDGNVVCFQDDLDSTCIKLGPKTATGADATNGPAIHIYPEKRLYLFYHEGQPIFRAERIDNNNSNNGEGGDNNNNNGNNNDNGGNNGNNNDNGNNDGNNGTPPNGDNSGNNNDNGDNDGNNGNNNDNGNNDGNNGSPPNGGDPNDNGTDPTNNTDNADDGHGWIIWVYYPEETAPKNSPTLSESGVTVTINGKLLTDADITGFAQFIGPNNEAGIQFFYATKSAQLLDLKIRMEGLVAEDDPVKFNINYLWSSQ